MSNDPLVGWRRWVVVRTPAGYRLSSWVRPVVWEPLEPFRAIHPARFRDGKHRRARAPKPRCICGVYAFSDVEPAFAWDSSPVLSAVGTVALWGRVVEHERGLRGEYAYPQRLRLFARRHREHVRSGLASAVRGFRCPSCDSTHALAHVVGWRDAAVPSVMCFCEACPVRSEPDAITLAEIQQELLDTYGVEVLP